MLVYLKKDNKMDINYDFRRHDSYSIMLFVDMLGYNHKIDFNNVDKNGDEVVFLYDSEEVFRVDNFGYIHDLVKLAYLAGLTPDDEQKKQLELISTFNIAGRYDDDKFALYKKATKEYATDYTNNAHNLQLWIQNRQQ